MAVKLRLKRFGRRHLAVFRLNAMDSRAPRDGRVLEEAYELVERGLLSAGDFRDFVFTNPASLHTRLNRDFFKGTRVESAVEGLLGSIEAG